MVRRNRRRGYPDVRARHEAGEYGEADLEILLLGTRAQWAREHPPPHAEAEGASASLRPVHNESDRGNVVGGGSTMVRGVIRAADVGVGGVQAQGRQQEQRGKSGGGSGGSSSNAKSTEGVDRGKSVKGGDRTSSGSRREGCCCYICDAPNHLSYDCPDHDEFDDDRDANCRKGDGGHRCRDNQPRKEKQASKTSSTKDADSSGGNAHGEEASCSMVGVVEPTISLALEAGEDFKVVASSMQANPTVVLLDGSCSHHLMGTKEAFADMQPSGDIRHVRGFTGALKSIKGRGTVALQGEAWKQVLVPDVLYVPDVHVNLLSAGQLKENGVKRQNDGGEMLLVSSAGDVLATKSTPDMWHARLAHVGIDTIKSSVKHEVAAGLDIKKSTADDLLCASCNGGKHAWHTFPNQGSDAENALDVVHICWCNPTVCIRLVVHVRACVLHSIFRFRHIQAYCDYNNIDLCGPVRVAANNGSLYFLLLKDKMTRYVRVGLIVKKSGVLVVFDKWLKVVERQTLKTGKMLRSDHGGPQQNGMAKREMRTVVEAVQTMLLYMRVKRHQWHLALRQAVWVRNCLERASLPSGTTPHELLFEKKPDLTLAQVWGCMVKFIVPEQQRGGKPVSKARWGLHLGVSPESKGWEVLDLTENKVVTTVEAVLYEIMSMELWKAEYGLASTRTPCASSPDSSSEMPPLLADVDEHDAEDIVEVLLPPPIVPPSTTSSPSPSPPIVDLP
ncbi:unnamed protein product [Closterium sp. NIES-54]